MKQKDAQCAARDAQDVERQATLKRCTEPKHAETQRQQKKSCL